MHQKAWWMHRFTHARAKTNMPHQLFQSWGHKKWAWATKQHNRDMMSHVMRKHVFAICETTKTQISLRIHGLISVFVVRCLDSIIPLVFIHEISSLYLASVAEQTGLSLTWSQAPKTGFLVTRLKSYYYSNDPQAGWGKQCRPRSVCSSGSGGVWSGSTLFVILSTTFGVFAHW